jgi:hypothetical protein
MDRPLTLNLGPEIVSSIRCGSAKLGGQGLPLNDDEPLRGSARKWGHGSSIGSSWHIGMLWGDDRSSRMVDCWANGCKKEESTVCLVHSWKEHRCEWSPSSRA